RPPSSPASPYTTLFRSEPLVRRHRALQLAHERGLVLDLLARDRVLRQQALVAREVDLRVEQLRAIARELTLGLRELDLERAGVEDRKSTRLNSSHVKIS